MVVMRIRELREQAGLSQYALAKMMGVKHPSVNQWENGRAYPTADKLPLLASCLHCEIDELYQKDSA